MTALTTFHIEHAIEPAPGGSVAINIAIIKPRKAGQMLPGR